MKVSLLFGWILLAYAASGQVRPFPSDDRGLLWKISGGGVSQDRYLFGTMHLMEEDAFLFPRSLDSIIRQSEVVIMELGTLPDPFTTLKLMNLKEEASFFDYFNRKEITQIIEWANKTLYLDEDSFRAMVTKLKPFAVVQLITQFALKGNIESYEMNIDRIVKEEKKTCIGLESIEEQIGFFDSLSNEEQKSMVLDAIEHSDQLLVEMNKMQALYRREHIDSLYMYLQNEESASKLPQDIFLDNRNANWIKILHPMLFENKRIFIAVGAGHLGGPNGILRKIEALGLTITPIQLHSLR